LAYLVGVPQAWAASVTARQQQGRMANLHDILVEERGQVDLPTPESDASRNLSAQLFVLEAEPCLGQFITKGLAQRK